MEILNEFFSTKFNALISPHQYICRLLTLTPGIPTCMHRFLLHCMDIHSCLIVCLIFAQHNGNLFCPKAHTDLKSAAMFQGLLYWCSDSGRSFNFRFFPPILDAANSPRIWVSAQICRVEKRHFVEIFFAVNQCIFNAGKSVVEPHHIVRCRSTKSFHIKISHVVHLRCAFIYTIHDFSFSHNIYLP